MRRLVVAVLFAVALSAQAPSPVATNISYAEASPILDALRDALPAALRSITPAEREAVWPAWVAGRELSIRERLERGDEDSLVNLLLFGTTFTRQPRAVNDSTRLGGRDRAAAIVRGRLSDLVAAIAAPGLDERLQFARLVVDRHGLDPRTAAGQEAVRRYLVDTVGRTVGEVDSFIRTLQTAKAQTADVEFAARSTLFHNRGLSSDTSLLPDYAIDQALAAVANAGTLRPGSVQRIAVIGPGLDFTDKAEGYDFYPVQTIQPFAIIDSVVRLGLANAPGLRVTAFDVSPRIIRHLETARERAQSGAGYVVHLPWDPDGMWSENLIAYWKRFGDQIGAETTPVAPPPEAGTVQVRAVRVRPSVVLGVVPDSLNIVLQRLHPMSDDDHFDLVIASNIFVYYDVVEQALALANVAAMLRPGGVLLSNNSLPALPATALRVAGSTGVVYSRRPDDSDRVVWYQRQ
ncbi:MAG: class I SAM-dependent methyltransferase [Acidobacteriota bacterium]